MTEANQSSSSGSAFRDYFSGFTTLKSCGREFWTVQLINLLDGAAYFAMLTVSTLYLSETLGYSDAKAAIIWALCTGVYAGVGCIAGFVGDSLGIKRTLYLSVVLLVAARLAISATTVKAIVIPALFLVAVGTAIMTPILISATKRYTNPKTQTAGFNLLYFLMNVGAFLGNMAVDPLRELEWGYRSIFMMGSAISILCWVSILLFWRKGIDKVDKTQPSNSAKSDQENEGASSQNQEAEQPEKWEAPWTIAFSVMRESAFWRFMLFLVILLGVRLVFEHQSQVYPKYYQRTMAEPLFDLPKELGVVMDEAGLADEKEADFEEPEAPAVRERRIPSDVVAAFAAHDINLTPKATIETKVTGGPWRIVDSRIKRSFKVIRNQNNMTVYDSDVPIGKLNSINPFIICFGVILSTPIVARFKLFNVMFVGITISASSMLVLVVYPGWFCHAFGMTLGEGYTVIAILQIVVFSVGEAIWSPRLYEYTAAIAPEGREASYMGLSYLPVFFARFAEGPIAGHLLTEYCPPDVTGRLSTVSYWQSPQFMSVILAVMAVATPILILVFRGVIQKESKLAKDTGQ